MREKDKPDGPRRGAAPIDGIVPRGQVLGTPQAPSLGGFDRRRDGFHPSRQSPGGIGGTAADLSAEASAEVEAAERDAVLEEPIVLDDMDFPRRGRKAHGKARFSRLRQGLRRAALVLLAGVVLTAGFLAYKFYNTQRAVLSGGGHAPAVCNGDVPLELLEKEGDGRVNILLLGIGSEGLLTDTIMVASLDPITDKVDLLSIPRDLWVNIPGNGRERINAAYEFGQKDSDAKSRFEINRDGVALVDKVLEKVMGVTIHYHAVFDFAAFKQIVDALGGVSVKVPETLYDPSIAWENHYNPVIATKGVQHFDGARALLYAKSRETSSDFARSERQRLLLVAIKDKALSLGTFSNPVKVAQLLNSLGNNVYSDFDSQSVKCLYKQVSEVKSNNIKSLDLATPPHDLVTTDNIAGRSVVRPKAGVFDYSQIHNYVRSAFRDGFLARENAKVAVYNATNTPGLATSAAGTLRSYGYNVTVVDNAASPTNPANTAVVDLSRGKERYTRHYLEQRFDAAATSSLPTSLGVNPPDGTAFVIIVGKDAAVSS